MFSFNNFNNFNNNSFQAMMYYKPIQNSSKISEYNDTSFINSVLQVLSSLDCVRLWVNNLNNNRQSLFNNSQCIITRELYSIFFSLYNGQNVDSYNFILNYNNKYKSVYNNNKLHDDPYHFLFFLIDLIHVENNYPPNPNFNLNLLQNRKIEELKNDNFMFNFFCSFYQQTQNSFISNYFYNIIKNEIDCEFCSKLYFYTFKYILKFDIEQYKIYRNQATPEKTIQNLSFEECFDCFTGGNIKKCNNCNQPNSKFFSSITGNAKILIIALIRKNHVFKCDVDFTNKLNIFPYCDTKNKNKTSYNLKACISMCNPGEYFSDILINNYWYRYYKNNMKMLGDVQKEIHTFEPQLLIYELEENNIQNSQSFNKPNNFCNNINQAIMNNQFNNIGFMPIQNWQQMMMQQHNNPMGQMQMNQNILINQSFNQFFQ